MSAWNVSLNRAGAQFVSDLFVRVALQPSLLNDMIYFEIAYFFFYFLPEVWPGRV